MQKEKAGPAYNTGRCDYCSKLLVSQMGYVMARAYLTVHGLFCRGCLKNWPGRIKKLCIYLPGCDVSDCAWYKGYDYEN